MSIVQFIKKIVSAKLGKKDLRDKLRGVAQKLEEIVLPALESILSNPDLQTPQSTYGKKFVADFLKMLPSSFKMKNPTFQVMKTSLTNMSNLCTLLDDYIGKDLPEQIYIDGITYQKATILRLVEFLDFSADYAARQMCYYVASETNVQVLNAGDKPPFTKAEEVTVLAHQHAYFKAIEMFYVDPKTIMANIGKIPEILITPETENLPGSMVSEVDPMKLGIVPLISPFFMFLGERKVDWDYERYERAKRELKDIQLRIEILRQKNTGGANARTESILKGYERELTLTRDRIAQLEARALRS